MRYKDYRLFIDDIRKSCEPVLRYTSGFTEEQFLADEKTYDATLRHLIIIGEVVKQIPEEVRGTVPGGGVEANRVLPRSCHPPLFFCQ